MARRTLARQIAAITLIVWNKIMLFAAKGRSSAARVCNPSRPRVAFSFCPLAEQLWISI